jgi:hypothetical protein
MTGIDPVAVVWAVVAVQASGLLCACVLRVDRGPRRQSSYHCVFLVLLGLVGLSTLLAAAWGPIPCLLSGTSLAVMSLAATCDFQSGRRALAR